MPVSLSPSAGQSGQSPDQPAGQSVSQPPAACQGSLEVFSCGPGLPDAVVQACGRLDLVAGTRALLDRLSEQLSGHFSEETVQKRLLTTRDLPGELERLVTCALEGQHVGLLASGDALYHGLGASLMRFVQKRFPDCFCGNLPCILPEGANGSSGPSDQSGQSASSDPKPLPFSLCFHPGLTVFQTLCHRLGLAWSEAALFCVHRKSVPWVRLLAAPLAIVYTGLPWTPARLAKALCAWDPGSGARHCLVAENMGRSDERLQRLTLAELGTKDFGPTSTLILLPEGARAQALPLGLDDERLSFDGHCLTHRRIRPLVLSCLNLPGHGVLWDLGAGSGSVGLEAALLQDGLTVQAVEKNPRRCAHIRANAAALGVSSLTLTEGDIVQSLPSLPDPDRIFVGGGGRDLALIVRQGLARLQKSHPDDPEAVLVATAITMESVATLTALASGQDPDCPDAVCPDAVCTDALSIDVSERAPMSRSGATSSGGPHGPFFMKPLHRIHIFVFRPGPAPAGSGS